VHKKNKERNTALIIAVWHGQVNMVEALINAGADVNVKNRNGNTALMLATANERKEIVRLLAAAGAVDKLDRTALMLPHSMMTTLP
jgi:ankyrin repeat protein